jgi:branched-chain amino acid transport system substrate-binding protein
MRCFGGWLELACGDSRHENRLKSESADVAGVDCGGAWRPVRGGIMKRQLKLAGLAVALSVAAHPAVAQEKLKIGVIVTLSGPAAVLGQKVRDGFALAVKDLGGKMSGRDLEVVAVDDELKPDGAVTKVKGLLERDKVDFVVGPIFSNILQAIHKPVTDAKTFLISPNAGPSSYARTAARFST